MLPDPLHNALPAIVRGACFVVTRCPADPRLSSGYQWTAAERPDVVAIDYDKAKRGGR